MINLKIISLLLEYPAQLLWDNQDEFWLAIHHNTSISEADKQVFQQFLQWYFERDLLSAQEHYINSFDRGRSTSLLLFEHVYGESRDRGQAMVDLLAEYTKAGLALDCKELPDFLPLYLEYLSICEPSDQQQGLQNVAAILLLLQTRLEKRQNAYAQLFHLLLKCVEEQPSTTPIIQRIAQESDDQTPQALDAVWQEENVTFLKQQGCQSVAEQQHKQLSAMRVMPQYLDIQPATVRSTS